MFFLVLHSSAITGVQGKFTELKKKLYLFDLVGFLCQQTSFAGLSNSYGVCTYNRK